MFLSSPTRLIKVSFKSSKRLLKISYKSLQNLIQVSQKSNTSFTDRRGIGHRVGVNGVMGSRSRGYGMRVMGQGSWRRGYGSWGRSHGSFLSSKVEEIQKGFVRMYALLNDCATF